MIERDTAPGSREDTWPAETGDDAPDDREVSALLDHLFGQQPRPRYTEDQVIALRETHGATLPHLSVNAQIKTLKALRARVRLARAAGHDTEKAEKNLAQREEMVLSSAGLQSFTDRHMLDAGGYAVANAGLLHRVEPVTTIATTGAYLLRRHAPDLEVIWQDYRTALDAHITTSLSALPRTEQWHRRTHAGKRLLSARAAALPEQQWHALAAKYEVSTRTIQRLVQRAETLIAQFMGGEGSGAEDAAGPGERPGEEREPS